MTAWLEKNLQHAVRRGKDKCTIILILTHVIIRLEKPIQGDLSITNTKKSPIGYEVII
jgi:hypothetical protein